MVQEWKLEDSLLISALGHSETIYVSQESVDESSSASELVNSSPTQTQSLSMFCSVPGVLHLLIYVSALFTFIYGLSPQSF